MSVNKVILVGHLAKQPEIKSAVNGNEFSLFSIVTTVNRVDKMGIEKQIKTFHNVMSFNKFVVMVAKDLQENDEIYVEGSLGYYEKNNENGSKNKNATITAESITVIKRKPKAITEQSQKPISSDPFLNDLIKYDKKLADPLRSLPKDSFPFDDEIPF